ncbi:hypothetical protein [Lyngbya aestuarii]|uniref:hypothetical protein n=1 Tax=Lyngbya aestuarii TaxID=118322 RepID=UPI00403DDCDA
MREELRQIAPTPPPAAEIFATYQLTQNFYQETQYRKAHESYCEWYRVTAERHQRELRSMRNDLNLFGWFCGRNRSH